MPTLQLFDDGPFRCLQGASRREEGLLAQLRGSRSLLSEKGPKDGLYVPTLWGGGGLGAHPEGMPQVGEP
jgi:hypothetical protein